MSGQPVLAALLRVALGLIPRPMSPPLPTNRRGLVPRHVVHHQNLVSSLRFGKRAGERLVLGRKRRRHVKRQQQGQRPQDHIMIAHLHLLPSTGLTADPAWAISAATASPSTANTQNIAQRRRLPPVCVKPGSVRNEPGSHYARHGRGIVLSPGIHVPSIWMRSGYSGIPRCPR